MTEFYFAEGEYTPDPSAPLGRHLIRSGDEQVPFLRYEGPHGPLEVLGFDHLRMTRVQGPAIAPVTLEWGTGSKADTGWKQRLRSGISAGGNGMRFRVLQPGFGLSRRARALRVEAEDRCYVARLRGAARHVLERPDGRRMVTFPSRPRRPGHVEETVDRLDAVILVLLWASGLLAEDTLGLLP